MSTLVTALGLLLCATSCMSGYEAIAADTDPSGWQGPVELRYANSDTMALKELSLVIRYSAEAAPDTGNYIVETVSPSGLRTRETLRIAMVPAANNNLHEAKAAFGTGFRFAETGDYVFTVVPLQKATGIWSVAINLEKSKRNGER